MQTTPPLPHLQVIWSHPDTQKIRFCHSGISVLRIWIITDCEHNCNTNMVKFGQIRIWSATPTQIITFELTRHKLDHFRSIFLEKICQLFAAVQTLFAVTEWNCEWNCHTQDCRKDAFGEQMIRWLPVKITESYKNDRMIAKNRQTVNVWLKWAN